MNTTKSHFPRSAPRAILRTRGGLLFTATASVAAAAAAAAFALTSKSRAIHENEVAQQKYKAPNGYVSVDRSGGGI